MQKDDGLKVGSPSGSSGGAGAPDHVDTESADERRTAIVPEVAEHLLQVQTVGVDDLEAASLM